MPAVFAWFLALRYLVTRWVNLLASWAWRSPSGRSSS